MFILALYYVTFQCVAKIFLEKFKKKKKNQPQKVEKKTPQKLLTYGSWKLLFSL